MKKIEIPTDEDFSALFERCIRDKYEPARTTLRESFPVVESLGCSYVELAENSRLHDLVITSELVVSANKKEELNKLYDERFAKNGTPGRGTYDQILIADRSRCPFCSHGRSWTVDHFLPKDKTKYPEFSLFPPNLVPACRDCNTFKSTHYGTTLEDQLFHPYFDDPDSEQWLTASLQYSAKGELTITFATLFHAHAVAFSRRVENQFKRLRLNELYSAQASSELEDIRPSLLELLRTKGAAGISARLMEDLDGFFLARKNSWKTAMYQALTADARFASMNWEL